jgi:chromate reductase
MKILALSGSARALSFNTRLLNVAVPMVEAEGAKVTAIGLRDFKLPIYDGDLETKEGLPESANALKALFCDNDGVVFASPEYNGSVTALLKNALDWCSRPSNGQDGLLAFRGKPAALLAASPSPFGGLRSIGHLRGILSKMGMHVLPDEILVPFAGKAFTPDGALIDASTQTLLRALCKKLVTECNRQQSMS